MFSKEVSPEEIDSILKPGEDIEEAVALSTFRFEAPKIVIKMTASDNELNNELGVNDPYDIGMFSTQKADGAAAPEEWNLVFKME